MVILHSNNKTIIESRNEDGRKINTIKSDMQIIKYTQWRERYNMTMYNK